MYWVSEGKTNQKGVNHYIRGMGVKPRSESISFILSAEPYYI